jgi:hypothetical protein
MIEPAEIERVA